MPGFEYKTNVDVVVNLLKKYNTTTATPYLSASLTSSIQSDNIKNENPELVTFRADNLPAIFVRISNATEDFSGIGPTGTNNCRKEKTIIYDLIGIYPVTGLARDENEKLEEIYNMSRNIEAVFQQNPRLTNTALWCNPRSTDFTGPFSIGEGLFLKTVLIELETKYLFR